jgi:hypothetical protein
MWINITVFPRHYTAEEVLYENLILLDKEVLINGRKLRLTSGDYFLRINVFSKDSKRSGGLVVPFEVKTDCNLAEDTDNVKEVAISTQILQQHC